MAQPEKYTSPVADLEGRKLLFIAYFFPPTISTGVPGCMRTIKFLRHLQGGECHVLTTPAADLSEADSALRHIPLPVNGETLHRVASRDLFHVLLAGRSRLKKLVGKNQNAPAPAQSAFRSTAEPENTSRNQLQKLKDFVYNLCYFPDQAGPWILPAVMRGRRVVRENNIDVIFATGSPWSDLIVGYLISRLTGKPLIVDFRDPWMNNPFHNSKGSVLDNWAHRWEKRIVEKADVVSLNTDPLRAEFLERYPEQPADKFFVMPNGYDPTDFGALEPSGEHHHPEDGWFTLCHAGFLYGVRDPAALLDAIIVANEKLAGSQKQIRFRQIGDVQLNYDLAARYQALIADGTLLLEPPRPYKQCLQALAKADMVVNIQPATRSQVPSKLYDYLAINRPIMNITPKDGALGRMVSEHGLGELFDFDETGALSDRLLALVESSQSQPPFAGYRNRALFDTRNTAADLAGKVKKLTVE